MSTSDWIRPLHRPRATLEWSYALFFWFFRAATCGTKHFLRELGDSSPSCVFHGNLDGVIKEDSPLGPGDVSVFFARLGECHARLSEPLLHFACNNLLEPFIPNTFQYHEWDHVWCSWPRCDSYPSAWQSRCRVLPAGICRTTCLSVPPSLSPHSSKNQSFQSIPVPLSSIL